MEKINLLSIIIPVYRGSALLDDTFTRLIQFERDLPDDTEIEIIAVDDGSDDDSYAKILTNQKRYPGKIRAIKLSRNYGATIAHQAGLEFVSGNCVANIPQDLQEPPELFLRMFNGWREGAKVNLALRASRKEPLMTKVFAGIYYFLFRHLAVPGFPPGGVCTYLIDRQVADEMRHYSEPIEPAVRLYQMGYPRRLHPYDRKSTSASNWTFAKRIKHAIDSFISLSYMPVRLMSVLGIVTAFASFLFAAYVFIGKVSGWHFVMGQPPGWATIIVLLTFLIGLVMTMLGIIGEYLWRILEATRNRPLYLIDEVRENTDDGKP